MKFKNREDEVGPFREIIVLDKERDVLTVEVDAKRVYIATSNFAGVDLTHAKALKFAQALVVELS